MAGSMVALADATEQPGVILRPATLDDAAMLLAWRNDPVTRQESINTDAIGLQDHQSWLKRVLENPARKLFIAESANAAVGTVRADYSPEQQHTELSWTVAPVYRGKGFGKVMVKLLADALADQLLYARVKASNQASINIALYAGFQFQAEQQGVCSFLRQPLR